jgi:hypothetical protein
MEDRGTDSQQSFKPVPDLSAGTRLGPYEVQGLIRLAEWAWSIAPGTRT